MLLSNNHQEYILDRYKKYDSFAGFSFLFHTENLAQESTPQPFQQFRQVSLLKRRENVALEFLYTI
jgi:hypothetical protein